MIWLLLAGIGLLVLGGRGGAPMPDGSVAPESMPDPAPQSDWRAADIEAAACAALDGDGVHDALELRWIVAKAAYPEQSWPMNPAMPLGVSASAGQRALYAQIETFARQLLAGEIKCRRRGGR